MKIKTYEREIKDLGKGIFSIETLEHFVSRVVKDKCVKKIHFEKNGRIIGAIVQYEVNKDIKKE